MTLPTPAFRNPQVAKAAAERTGAPLAARAPNRARLNGAVKSGAGAWWLIAQYTPRKSSLHSLTELERASSENRASSSFDTNGVLFGAEPLELLSAN